MNSSLTYQLLVFVADVQDKVTIFQTKNLMAQVEYPAKLKLAFKAVKYQLVLINGIKIHAGCIQISKRCSMIRVLQRGFGCDRKNGMQVCPDTSYPKGKYNNWPSEKDEEGRIMLSKVFPVVNEFFERCSLLYLTAPGKFQITTALDSFLHTQSIYNEWAFLDRQVGNTKHLTLENDCSTNAIDEWGEAGENSKSKVNETPKRKANKPVPSKPIKSKKRLFQAKKRVLKSNKVKRPLFIPSEKPTMDNANEKSINLMLSSDESDEDLTPTEEDQAFIDDSLIEEVRVRPIIQFASNQREEFKFALNHFNKCLHIHKWKAFPFKLIREKDFCQIVCQTMTGLDHFQNENLENFVYGGGVADDDLRAIFSKMKTTPPDFSFDI